MILNNFEVNNKEIWTASSIVFNIVNLTYANDSFA